MDTRVVKGRRANGVYIGRGSVWGNPFVIGVHGTREEVIAKYEPWLLRQPDLVAMLPELRGRVLCCHCKPLACHGDVLARLADQTGEEHDNGISHEGDPREARRATGPDHRVDQRP